MRDTNFLYNFMSLKRKEAKEWRVQRGTVKMRHNDVGVEEFDIKSNAHISS